MNGNTRLLSGIFYCEHAFDIFKAVKMQSSYEFSTEKRSWNIWIDCFPIVTAAVVEAKGRAA